MPTTFMPSFHSLEELAAHQLKGLQWTVTHAYGGSAFYRKKFEEAGIKPEDIKTLADIQRLPFVTAQDLRDGYPFPLLSVPLEQVVRVHASTGTTGKRKILAYSQKDIDDWAHFFARCYELAGLSREDRVQIAVGYGVWTAGVGFQLGCERFGALAIPIGPGNIDLQCQFLEDLRPTVMCCTASMGLLMAEEVEKRGLRDKIALKKMIFGSERSSDAQRKKIKDLLGLEDLFDIPGLTELYGPGTGLDCALHEGIHYWADYYILEVLDPVSLEPVRPGETGEMVVTTLVKEAAPLIRYRTRDLTRLIGHPCSCGNLLPLHDRILGRSDDMIIFRGVNLYPAHIDHILSQMAVVGSEYQILLSRESDGKEAMIVRVERVEGKTAADDGSIAGTIEQQVKKLVLVSARVELVDYGTLPLSERKSKRVFDDRM
jgi:phenylacetate-CoA ligase